MTESVLPVPRIHIVGRKNAGKTTLVCRLVEELSRQGRRVATVKHTHHHHELDTPGKDSHRHRNAGAAGVGILSPEMTAAFLPITREQQSDGYAAFSVMFRDCDIIIVEGDLSTTSPKIEVWRQQISETPYAAADKTIHAVVSDDPVDTDRPVWPTADIAAIASGILHIVQS